MEKSIGFNSVGIINFWMETGLRDAEATKIAEDIYQHSQLLVDCPL